jgi:hypothetical protein
MFLKGFNILILKINLKIYIILICFQIKNTLKKPLTQFKTTYFNDDAISRHKTIILHIFNNL